jgi:hypothetical protein
MFLAIQAQDLQNISIALFDGGLVGARKDFQTSPEFYLQTIDNALTQWSVSKNELKGVVVVTGPGSFTSSRVSTTIANALAFTRDIPVFTLENSGYKPLVTLLEGFDPPTTSARAFAFPVYGSPAHITKPKNHLG